MIADWVMPFLGADCRLIRGGHRNKGYTLFPPHFFSVKTLQRQPYPMGPLISSEGVHAVTTASAGARRGQGRRLQDHHLAFLAVVFEKLSVWRVHLPVQFEQRVLIPTLW